MSDNDDLEIQALQRQLDDAFETTRPRAAFEDELWSRMQAGRPLWSRIQDVFTGLIDSVRAAPAVPAAAAAVVLIFAIGIGIVSQSGLHFGGAGSTASQGSRPASAGDQYSGTPGGFGRLPAPALQPIPGTADTGGPKAVSPSQQSGTNVYLGPATLIWTGQLNVRDTNAPVYRYQEPSAAQADEFAASRGAAPAVHGQTGPGYLGSYDGQGFTLSVSMTWPKPAREPRFFIVPTGTPPPGTNPTAVATAFLMTHSVMPTWPNTVDVASSGDQVRVQFLRVFQMPSGESAYLVGIQGDRYGTDVLLQSGRPAIADGPLPLNLEVATYPLISASQAVQLALGSSPSAAETITPPPVVHLDKVELVYALAYAGDHSFFEPAYLFSGTLTQNGATLVKRVLVSAVNPSQRSS